MNTQVFMWLGLYFDQRHGLGPVGIRLALVGYGWRSRLPVRPDMKMSKRRS